MSCGSGMLQQKEKMSEVDGHPQQEKSRKRSIDQSSSVIDIKIKGQDGVEVFFRIQTNTMLLKVLRAYCQKRNLAYKTVEFLYEGDRFPVKRTPHDMEGGKWEDLNMDCLVNVFGRVGIESLLLDVPFMCKSWYKATLSPLCWRLLDFSKISLDSWSYDESISRLLDKYQLYDKLSVTAFIKFVVKRSARSATFLSLPDCCTEEALLCVADECPDLRALLLPQDLPDDHMLQIPILISKWKNLEILRLGGTFQMQEVLAQINIHCKNFIGLAIARAHVEQDEASAIVTLLPNIKQLFLRHAYMEKENLVMILQGCKELEYFDVRHCIGFDEGDDEILKLASHIRTFKDEGSMLYDYDDDYCPTYRVDGFHDGDFSD